MWKAQTPKVSCMATLQAWPNCFTGVCWQVNQDIFFWNVASKWLWSWFFLLWDVKEPDTVSGLMVANWDSKHLGISGEVFHVLHGIIQVIQGVTLGSPSQYHRLFLHAAVSLQGARLNPRISNSLRALLKERKRTERQWRTGGLANSRSTAVTSQPARSHHTARLRTAPRAAGFGSGYCRRPGQVGRILSRSPPPRPGAPRSRRWCPGPQRCPHTPWGECFLEDLCGESSGQTHGGKTKAEGKENTHVLRLIGNSVTFTVSAQINKYLLNE